MHGASIFLLIISTFSFLDFFFSTVDSVGCVDLAPVLSSLLAVCIAATYKKRAIFLPLFAIYDRPKSNNCPFRLWFFLNVVCSCWFFFSKMTELLSILLLDFTFIALWLFYFISHTTNCVIFLLSLFLQKLKMILAFTHQFDLSDWVVMIFKHKQFFESKWTCLTSKSIDQWAYHSTLTFVLYLPGHWFVSHFWIPKQFGL